MSFEYDAAMCAGRPLKCDPEHGGGGGGVHGAKIYNDPDLAD